MTTKRDSLFPSASVGRAHGASIVRTPSRETLAVHPLLNPGPPSGATLDNAKYVPYTPRQRQATTGPPVQAQPAPSQSTVPPKPQLTNFRDIAQGIGLDTNSIGRAILEKISYEGDTSDEWSEIWNALTKSKATLLLPSEQCSGHDLITPEFVQDHLILCDLASRENTPVVTLSGLRGQFINDSLTFRSTLHRSTKAFQAIVAPSTSRAASLDALPPLPGYPPESSYPSFTVSAFSTPLPFPSRATKPSLPPRPGTRSGPAPSPARLAMPFASLFGQRPSTPPPHPPTAAATVPPSTDADVTIDISALVIDTVLSRADIATGIINALKGEIAIALNDQPPWLVERVHTFSLPYFPFAKVPAGKKKLQDIGGNPNRIVYAVNATLDKPEELADKFQAFYRAVEAELREGGHQRVQGTREDGADMSRSQDSEPDGEMEEVNEVHIRDILETIESTLCTLLYDRLFLPSTSDDASHNEALSSRIAALNMLDLGLEHLDIDVGNANQAEVDVVVRTCGQSLSQLDLIARCPREKAAVLVSAHKLVVDGLSKIPPVRLKSREDDSKELTKPSGLTDSTGNTSLSSTVPVAEKDSPSIPTESLSTSPDRLSALEQPLPETSPQSPSSPVSGDVLLPILIFSVVKANPSRLVSHLLFTQRFRNQSFGGEESYCLINLMAVAEFLENVDLGALGLGESEKKVLSTAELTPIPRPGVSESPIAATLPGDEFSASLRGRVEQGVDAIAGSANKVILGVVDTSFGVLRAFLPGQTPAPGGVSTLPVVPSTSGARTDTSMAVPVPAETGEASQTWVRPSLGLLRRETGSAGFSIAGLTVALPGTGRGRGSVPDGQREMVEVASRPASLKSHQSGYGDGDEAAGSSEGSRDESGDGDGGEDGEDGEDEREGEGEEESGDEEEEEVHDARSIKSFESMLSSGRTRRRTTGPVSTPASVPASTSAPPRRRKRLSDLTDRLTHGMAGMSRRVQGSEGRGMATTLSGRLPPPNRRFVECTEQDIRVSEVGELLREYQRLVEAVRSMGGFQE
ncbi:hypothetical protein JVU11DRAFT_6202 [Chiua virens]|nr:hypothetical protein JVU11DRAFT_6202 [Chiua virens]